ncbi:hypothetical protein L484_023767 [Morus notabilis]|uniref:Amino acid transporter transmembrane domain-containing protein n=1 Tax=Morus notabilis TaxID=981085 RepID=W9R173_9ROSA|nr:probable amino acid permease 7 [Morus notabilis]EXB51064.1 hypothetical protein L484_023767 [Morus notabilis]
MGDIRANHQKTPLLDKQFPELPLSRTGNVWTAVAHIITGVIGSGVLSLSWCMAQLGWIAGPVAMLSFAITTLFSAFLLCNCYRSPDPETGPFRNRSYIEAVDMNLGKKKALACGLLLQLSLYGFGIAYTVTSGISMRAIQETNCYHKEGREATCVYGDSYYILLFGVAQIILSQIPNFHNIQWLSVVAAIMSFTYALVGLGLAAVKVIGTGYAQGSISGIPTPNAGQKVWLVSQALGDIAFSYPFSLILFEIQDTLEAPPSESETMKKASAISITITTFFYLFCGGFGYAAFGDATPGNLMTAFGSYEPYWLVDLANVCIVLHLVGGYQIYSQPLFAGVEKWLSECLPYSGFVNNNYELKIPPLGTFRLNPLRLCFRTAYVVSTTAIAMAFPYFNQILGVLGGMNFWPLTIYFPIEMYLKQTNVQSWTPKWVMLRILSGIFLLVTVFALIGSIQGLVSAKLS